MKALFVTTVLLISGTFSYAQNATTQKGKPNPFADGSETASQVNPKAVNVFPVDNNVGIGILKPTAPLEIKAGAGNTRGKNVLLKLSNEYAASGQNEPSIMFSNGDYTNPRNVSYWTIGARVSGDNVIKSPQTFKISYKGPNDPAEKEFFSVDSYQGRVRIGNVPTDFDGYKLYVEEGILTEKVKVAIKGSKDWFDHVFEPDYKLMPLPELEKFIQKNKHLPGIPTATEVVKDGLDLGKMNALLLQKVEELTLHVIELKKELEETKKHLKKQ